MKRLIYLDVCKGILILLLLVNHFYSAINRLDIDISNNYLWILGIILITFTPCFMQTFFFISGYCSNFNKPMKEFIISLFKQILIPYLTFSVIGWLLPIIFPLTESYSTSLSTFGRGLWFLNALFISKLLLYFIIKHIRSTKIIIIVIFLCLFLGILLEKYDILINFFYIRHGLISIFFVGLGFLFKKNQLIMKYGQLISSVFYPFLILLLKATHIEIPLMASGILVTPATLPLFLLLTISGTFAFIQYSKLLQDIKPLIYFGQNSLIVYGMHFYFLLLFTKIFYQIIQPESLLDAIIYFIVLYSTDIVIMYLLTRIMNTKYLSWSIGKF